MSFPTFTWNQKDVRALEELVKARNASFLEAVRSGWQRAGLSFIGYVVKNQMRGRPGLKVGHGQLWRSFFPVTNKNESAYDVVSRITTDVPYARIHQYGGTIRPKRKRFLFVPTSAAGRTKHRPGGKPSAEGLQYGRDYVLRRSVHIPKRLHILEHYRVEGLAMYVKELRRAMNNSMRGTGS